VRKGDQLEKDHKRRSSFGPSTISSPRILILVTRRDLAASSPSSFVGDDLERANIGVVFAARSERNVRRYDGLSSRDRRRVGGSFIVVTVDERRADTEVKCTASHLTRRVNGVMQCRGDSDQCCVSVVWIT